jgi:hypothetical protein
MHVKFQVGWDFLLIPRPIPSLPFR